MKSTYEISVELYAAVFHSDGSHHFDTDGGAQSVLIDYSHFAAAQGNARPIRRVYDLTGRYDALPMPSARGFSQAEFLDFGERWVGEPVLPGGWRAGNQPGDKWQP